MTQAVFESARTKTERGKELRDRFKQAVVANKLERVATDLALNRMFLEPELAVERRSSSSQPLLAHTPYPWLLSPSQKWREMEAYFEKKLVDPNLDVREIMAANPTQFFHLCHRRLPILNCLHPCLTLTLIWEAQT